LATAGVILGWIGIAYGIFAALLIIGFVTSWSSTP